MCGMYSRQHMRIAFLCTSSLDDPSPRGRWLPVARELARLGHEPRLLLLHPTFDTFSQQEAGLLDKPDSSRIQTRSPASKTQIIDGVVCEHVAQMHVYGSPGQRRYFGGAELARVAASAARALYARAVAFQPDAIQVCKPQPMNGAAGWLAARRLGAPLFVDCDDYEVAANRTSAAWQRAGIRWCEDTLPAHAAAITANTRFLMARYRALGVPSRKIFYAPNGIAAADGPAPRQDIAAHTVIYVGAMNIQTHSVDVLLDAFALLQKELPAARLSMVGDGDDRPALQAQAARLGVAGAVAWAGRVPPAQARAMLARVTCSADPARDEPAMRGRSPLKIVESMAAGVPVVTSDVGDRREMLGDGAAGVLVAPGSPQALADGLRAVLTDAALREDLSRAALARADLYRWEVLAQEWVKAYASVR